MVVLGGRAVSYERGTPVQGFPTHEKVPPSREVQHCEKLTGIVNFRHFLKKVLVLSTSSSSPVLLSSLELSDTQVYEP